VTRRLRVFPLEELFVAQAIPGLLLAVGWTVMYEVYHEDGAFYTSLLQEILGTEGLFPHFVISAILMAFPLGMVLDSVRHVLGEVWLRLPERCCCGSAAAPLAILGKEPASPTDRYLLYRHLRAIMLTPAKAAGNLAVVFAIFIVWFVVKMYRMQAWHVFSRTFLVGTPLVGLAIMVILLARYRREMRAFLDLTQVPPHAAPSPPAAGMPPPATQNSSSPDAAAIHGPGPAPGEYQ